MQSDCYSIVFEHDEQRVSSLQYSRTSSYRFSSRTGREYALVKSGLDLYSRPSMHCVTQVSEICLGIAGFDYVFFPGMHFTRYRLGVSGFHIILDLPEMISRWSIIPQRFY